MKLREKLKRFWTLDVHNHEGFTLVELIIVIAILAILSTGAIAGYSVYIKQANITTDEALAAEIENALILAYYSGTLKDGASVVVYYGDKNATVDANGDLGADAAMRAAFGDNYAQTLRLKWSGWKDKMSAATNATMMQAVKDSQFTPENLNTLLSQVQAVVDAASGAIANNFESLTITDSLLLDAVSRAGVTLENGKLTSADDAQAVANALVFSVAGDITKTNIDHDAFAEAWTNYALGEATSFVYSGPNGEALNGYSTAAIEYASILALAQYVDALEGTTYATTLQNTPSYKNNRTAFQTYMIDDMVTRKGGDEDAAVAVFTGYFTAGETDALAFLAYMNGADASSESVIANNPLGSSGYFNNDDVLNYVRDYVSISDALTGIDVGDGAFVFYFNESTGTVACLPLDY